MIEGPADASGDPWGSADPPVVAEADLPPLPRVLADIVAAFEAGESIPLPGGATAHRPGVDDLLEVQRLAADGWLSLPSGGLGEDGDLLPAVWPPEHRCWVPDRLPGFAVISYGGQEGFIEPEMHGRTRRDWEVSRTARSVGLPPRPRGRLWLIRSPWPRLHVRGLLRLVRQVRDEDQLGWDAVATMRAAQRVLAGTEAQAWARWSGPRAAAAKAWLEQGAGVDVDRWVDLGLGPDQLRALTSPLADGGAGLTTDLVPQWCEAVCSGEPRADVVERVLAWRRTGLPGDAPVARLASVMWERRPEEVARWLDAGFTADEVADWEADDLPRAVRWREAGLDARQARELVLADPALTPEEALAFDAVGIEPARRVRWVAAGFSATEAREWTDLDVVASEARVWRSLGLGARDARAQRAGGAVGPLPVGFEGGWAAFGSDRDDMRFGVSDPPGTRGSLAAEQTMEPWAGPDDLPPDFGEPVPGTDLGP